MKHSLIFISTPYSHENHEIKDIRYRQAIEYAAILMNGDRFAYSPIASGLAIAKSHKLPTDWCNFCEAMLERCDELHVLMLKGWDESTGVANEIRLAKELGLKILYIDPSVILKETLNLKTLEEKLERVKNYLKSDAGKKYIQEVKDARKK